MTKYVPLIALLAVALVRYARNFITNRFFYTDTISPQSAKKFKDIGVTDLFLAKVLIFQGIIKGIGNDLYYLDLDRKYQIEKSREKVYIALIILSIVFLIGAAAYYFLR